MNKLLKKISELKKVFKESGFRGLIKTYGWKIVAAFFAYYLIRDITLYILIPYFLAQKVIAP